MKKSFKKGETSLNGSIYKVDLVEKKPIGIDDEIRQQHLRILNYKENSEKYIARHNQLIKIREEVATTPDEYIRCGLRTVSIEDLRRLIIAGCDKEMNECQLALGKINDSFKLEFYNEKYSKK